MAVSYLSTPVKSSPYVNPVDLNLMAKVLEFQQTRFDTESQKIQSQIDTIGSLDILKNEDREYVNNKLTNIVNSVNNLGGVNLADYNISGQIEGLASSVYGDDKVVSAISSTKRARSLMSSYDKMKTDPKLVKLYSAANEAIDKESLGAWMNDGQVGSSYSGPSVATPYYDYNDDFQKAFKNVQAQENVTLTNEGYYINKVTKKTFTAAQIMASARDMLTIQQREQMQRDGKYLYKYKMGYGEEALVNKAVSHKVEELNANRQLVAHLEHASFLEKDPKSRLNIQAELKQKQSYTSALEKEIANAKDVYSNVYKAKPDELMYMVYSNDYFRGLGRRYEIYKEDRSATPDQAKLTVLRENRADNRQVRSLNAARELTEYKEGQETERTMLRLQAEGKAKKDASGKWQIVDAGSAAGEDGAYVLEPNKNPGDVDAYVAADKARLGINPDGLGPAEYVGATLANPIGAVYSALTKQAPTGGAAPGTVDADIEAEKQSFFDKLVSSNPRIQAYFNSHKADYDKNQDGKLTIGDFQGMDKTGKFLAYSTITDIRAQRLVADALQGFESLSEGKNIAVNKFPEGLDQTVEKINLLNQEKKGLIDRIKAAERGQDQYMRMIFSDRTYPIDAKFQTSREMGVAKSIIARKGGIDKKTDPSEITVISIGKNTNGEGYNVTYKEKDQDAKQINIKDSEAAYFNVEDGPYSVLNRTVYGNNDFVNPVQNQHDYKFVAKLRTYQVGNTNEFRPQYGVVNPATNELEFMDIPGLSANSAAKAYKSGKDLINKFGAGLKPEQRVNLQKEFQRTVMKID